VRPHRPTSLCVCFCAYQLPKFAPWWARERYRISPPSVVRSDWTRLVLFYCILCCLLFLGYLWVYFFLWCSSRLCSRSSYFCHVYHPTQHSHFLTFSKPPHLCRWYLTFVSFHPRNFDSSIAYLQTALKVISSWISANLLILLTLRLNFSIGLKQQLSKIDNSSLNTTHSARNLGFIFDENVTFCDQISTF